MSVSQIRKKKVIINSFKNIKIFLCFRVTVYNVSKLFPWDRNLASKYTVWKTDPVKACKDNFKFACDSQRLDLAKIWKICSKVAQLKTTSEHFSVPWSLHPLGKPLLKSIIDHCINSGKKK